MRGSPGRRPRRRRRCRRSADFRDDLVRQGSDLLVDVVPVRRVVQAWRSYPLREELFRGVAARAARARVSVSLFFAREGRRFAAGPPD